MPRTSATSRFVARIRETACGVGNRLLHVIPGRIVAVLRGHRTAMMVLTAAAVMFGALAAIVMSSEGTLLRFDRSVQSVLLDLRTGWLDRAMIWLTFLGTRYVIALGALGLFIWSQVTKKHRAFVLVIVAAAILNPVVEIGFKELVGRVRPAVDQLLPGNGPSFPSGHVLAAVGFYGLIPLLAWEAITNAWGRFAVFLGSLGVVSVVTVSRPYLDVHWTTDAIAGVLLGTVSVVLSYQVYLGIAGRGRVPAA